MKINIVNGHSMKNRLFLQRGASLLEGIAYLGIAAIVILGAVSLLNGAFGSAQSNRSVEEVISIRTAAKKLYSGQPYPADGGDMTASLAAARALPSSLVVAADGTVTNTWNGTVTVTGSGTTFTITYAAVPQDVCTNMISGATGWQKITGGGGTGNAVTAFPATPAAAAAACTAGANTVAFVAA